MDTAVRVVPKELRGCSALSVKATAGLRLLGESKAENILRAVERRLKSKYPFPIKDMPAVMDGKEEGVYAWITANYLLSTLSPSSSAPDTYAVLDLGGGSTQIVFHPRFPDTHKSGLEEGEHKYELKFAGREFTLYQHSYLGYGLKSARMSVHRLVAFMHSLSPSASSSSPSTTTTMETVPNPCIIQNTNKTVEIQATSFFDVDEGKGKRNVSMSGYDGVGGFEKCMRVVELVIAKDA